MLVREDRASAHGERMRHRLCAGQPAGEPLLEHDARRQERQGGADRGRRLEQGAQRRVHDGASLGQQAIDGTVETTCRGLQRGCGRDGHEGRVSNTRTTDVNTVAADSLREAVGNLLQRPMKKDAHRALAPAEHLADLA